MLFDREDKAYQKQPDPSQKRKLTENEKQNRLAQMQENAKWREDVRTNNIESYKKEKDSEKRLHEESVSKKAKSAASHLFK